jgi:hypothetical protein
MPLPKWRDLKNAAKVDPDRAAELRRGAQRGVEQGRAGLAKRLAGPAAHLRTVGSEFKAGLTQPEPTSSPEAAAQPAAAPAPPVVPETPAPPASPGN